VETSLSVEDLSINFHTLAGKICAVDHVSFNLFKGETLGMVGESGCGKSVTAMSLLQLIPTPPGEIAGGRAVFEGQDLLRLNPDRIRKVRGNRISMIFQEPMTSLNPVFRIGYQIGEAIRLHQGISGGAAIKQTIEILDMVGIPDPKRRINEYPHQLSGGMRQRVMIAMALSCNPEILIADEPTTALDVTVQAQILELMLSLQSRTGMGILMITHDLGVIAETANRVLVMYCGRVVESADVNTLFKDPLHPYTQQLFQCVPRIDLSQKRLQEIPGMVPTMYSQRQGCNFEPRCNRAVKRCRAHLPDLTEIKPGHQVACNIVCDR